MMYIEQAPLGGNLLKILKNSASLSNGTATKEPNVVNGENSLPNGNCQSLFLKPAEAIRKRKIDIPEVCHPAQDSLAAEDEEEEQYELIDIIEESEKSHLDQTGKTQHESLPNGYVIELNLGDSVNDISTLQDAEDLVGIVDNEATDSDSDSEGFEYRLVKIPKRKTRIERKADFNIILKPTTKQRPPVPAAIPFDQHLKTQNRRLLNGISTRQLATGVYELPSHSINDTSAYSCFESGLEDGTFNDNRSTNEQMGIDIIGGIRQLLNWRPKSGNTDTVRTEIQIGKRKRRSENLSTDGQFKYRKVANNFPKIITHCLEDDADYSSAYHTPIVNTQRNPADIPKFVHPKQSNFEMTLRETEQKSQRSWFKPPQSTNKTVRNTSYADIEFSDDDDDSANRLRQSIFRGNRALENSTLRKQPRVHLIQQEQPPNLMTSSTLKQPLPSSITRRYETPHTMFNMDSLRFNIPFATGVGDVLNGRCLSSNASSGSGASTSRFGNEFVNTSRLSTKALGRSIVVQDREREQHAQYKHLLETINRAQMSRPDHSNACLSGNISKKPRVSSKFALPVLTQRAPLSSTVNIDDDDEDDYDDVAITGVTHLKSSKPPKKRDTPGYSSIIIDDDDEDICEIIDLDKEESKRKTTETIDLDAKENKRDDLPYVEPINSLRDILGTMPLLKDCWFQNFNTKWEEKRKLRDAEISKTLEITNKLTAERRAAEPELQERFREFRIVDPELLVVDDFAEPEVEEEPEFPELNADRQARIKAAIYGPPDQILVEKFNMSITRRDIQTLLGHNWLNDEVINFYMNLITERSEIKHESHGYPTVYAMNTFFLQRLSQNGHGGVKRWTRKVNIFEKDILPVPVHVGGVHWCMAIIHLKNRWIRYYDSMGAPNPSVLKLLEQYLKDESLDKRKQPFDTSGFVIESVRDVPRQMNGSDCGVFSCMFAEYVSRNKEITFSQQHMEYFRHKMILEIVQGQLLL